MKSHLSGRGTPVIIYAPLHGTPPLQTPPLFGLINREGEGRCYPLAPAIRTASPQRHPAIDRVVLLNETVLPSPLLRLFFGPPPSCTQCDK